MKDNFMDSILEICQEAIDGGYSKAKHLCILWDPKLGVVELRSADHAKLLHTALSKYPGATRIAICIQRKQADGAYVVTHAFVLGGMMLQDEYRWYNLPLSADGWKVVRGSDADKLAEEARK